MPSAFLDRFQEMRRLYDRVMAPVLEQYRLTKLEMDILLFLANNPERNTARDMVELRHLAKSHVSVGVDSLVRRGLVERRYQPGNRKVIRLGLLPAAAELVAVGREAQRRYGEILLAGVAPEERAALAGLLDRVRDNVAAALERDRQAAGRDSTN